MEPPGRPSLAGDVTDHDGVTLVTIDPVEESRERKPDPPSVAHQAAA
jgi:hypothetical protein